MRGELAPEPAYGEVSYVSDYEIDPFTIPDSDKVTLLSDWSAGLLAHDLVAHADAHVHSVLENKFYADTAGTVTVTGAGTIWWIGHSKGAVSLEPLGFAVPRSVVRMHLCGKHAGQATTAADRLRGGTL